METKTDEQRRPPRLLLKAANPLVRMLLRSPLHRLLSGQLMLLVYRGRRSGRMYTFPVGYFTWGDDQVIAFSSARWWVNLRDGRTVRLLLRGRWQTARPVVAETLEAKTKLRRSSASVSAIARE